ncbi:putative regulatory protein [Yersinia mollaretii]|uniref:Rz-like lysis system protein LysB n=1 Tax=Yersinia mollaretii TaxID=33060 RepID=UPI0005E70786|nr:Rz-like lysis system protein LysB [Yersinia mollaretii]CNJ96596.1 putative regulatory protein [Yersinia mollaretii]
MRIAMMVIVTLLVVLGWYANRLSHDIVAANRIIGTLSAGIKSRDNAITRLQDEVRRRADNERALRQSLSHASTLSLSHEQKIQRLLNENKVLRDWFATTLPADVIRLHQRPAFANPNDYLRWLSDSDQLPAIGQQSGN